MKNFLLLFQKNSNSFVPEVFGTVLILLSVFFVIHLSGILINKQEWSLTKKRQYSSFIRNLALVIGLAFLFFTWRGEIKAFIFSVSALTVGIFVAFKEVILSFFSYFIISSNKLFKIGDIIEVDEKIGKVIDRSLLYTKISMVGTHHGKEMTLPNNLFVIGKLVNLSAQELYSKTLILHTESQNLKYKVDFLKKFLELKLQQTACTFEFYLEPTSAIEITIKIVIKNISPQFDYNGFKNEATIDFLQSFPAQFHPISKDAI